MWFYVLFVARRFYEFCYLHKLRRFNFNFNVDEWTIDTTGDYRFHSEFRFEIGALMDHKLFHNLCEWLTSTLICIIFKAN